VSPHALLGELRNRGVHLSVEGDALRYRGPRGALTPELREAVAANKPELVRLLSPSNLDADAGELAAVMLRKTVIGGVWLVADDEALADHPDIIRSGLPVFLFSEVEQLRGKTPAELKAFGMMKAAFPTSRLVQ
jgi:hypothetical protein